MTTGTGTDMIIQITHLAVAALQACHKLCLVVVALLSALKRLFDINFIVRSHLSFSLKHK